jgi:hypothetical protein
VRISATIAPNARTAVRTAMTANAIEFYRLAGRAWSVSLQMLTHDTEELGRELYLDDCAPLRSNLNGYVPIITNTLGSAASRGYVAAREFQTLWQCASEKIVEAEALLE